MIMKYSSATHPGDEVKKFHRIRNCMFLSGLSVFAQLYLFQPMLSDLCRSFQVDLPTSSLAVSTSTIGMAVGLLFFAFKADAFRRDQPGAAGGGQCDRRPLLSHAEPDPWHPPRRHRGGGARPGNRPVLPGGHGH